MKKCPGHKIVIMLKPGYNVIAILCPGHNMVAKLCAGHLVGVNNLIFENLQNEECSQKNALIIDIL